MIQSSLRFQLLDYFLFNFSKVFGVVGRVSVRVLAGLQCSKSRVVVVFVLQRAARRVGRRRR